MVGPLNLLTVGAEYLFRRGTDSGKIIVGFMVPPRFHSWLGSPLFSRFTLSMHYPLMGIAGWTLRGLNRANMGHAGMGHAGQE